jgi:glycerophosphoryl diester phosphodiesterase
MPVQVGDRDSPAGGRLPAVWGHRGASVAQAENTLAAFVEARDQGADGVELDVRRSRDGGLVVHHDARLADGRSVAEVAVAGLPPSVPLLQAALEACTGMVVNIEIKNVEGEPDHDPTEQVAADVVALLADRRAAGLDDDVLVSSFSLASLDRVAALDPAIRLGYLASPRWDQARCLERAADRGHSAFHPHHLAVNGDLVGTAHDRGLAVHAWTVDDPDRIRWLAAAGVDAVITNLPDVAIRALREPAGDAG